MDDDKYIRIDHGCYVEIYSKYVESDGHIYSFGDYNYPVRHISGCTEPKPAEMKCHLTLEHDEEKSTIRISVPAEYDGEPITFFEMTALQDNFVMPEYLYIPASIRIINISAQFLTNSEGPLRKCRVEISPDNPYFCVYKNGIYSKDMKKLYYIFLTAELPDGCFEVPDGVEYIERYAALYLRGLKKLVIPESVKAVKSTAFMGCPDLEEADIRAEKLDAISFCVCKKLRKVRLPNCRFIGAGAFNKCSELSTVELGNIEIIESDAFRFTNIKELTIPPSIRELGRIILRHHSEIYTAVEIHLKDGDPNAIKMEHPIADQYALITMRHDKTDKILYRFCIPSENSFYTWTPEYQTFEQYMEYISQKLEEGLMRAINSFKTAEIINLPMFEIIDSHLFLRLIDISAKKGLTELTAALMQKLHERESHE